jgi:hypothetical protein
MGAWGDGIFDSDQSCDFAGEIINNLKTEIQSGLYLLVTRQDDYHDSGFRVVPAIRLILVISQEAGIYHIDLHEVKKWKQVFFDKLNPARIAGGHEPFPADDKVYENYEKTFDDLIKYAEAWEHIYQQKKDETKKQKEE